MSSLGRGTPQQALALHFDDETFLDQRQAIPLGREQQGSTRHWSLRDSLVMRLNGYWYQHQHVVDAVP
jgi:hypothetical protein